MFLPKTQSDRDRRSSGRVSTSTQVVRGVSSLVETLDTVERSRSAHNACPYRKPDPTLIVNVNPESIAFARPTEDGTMAIASVRRGSGRTASTVASAERSSCAATPRGDSGGAARRDAGLLASRPMCICCASSGTTRTLRTIRTTRRRKSLVPLATL